VKKIIKNMIKNNKVLYAFYNFLFSFFLNCAARITKIDTNQALFVVYGGKRYDDSPRFVYEYIKKQPEYQEIKCVWAFISPNDFDFIPENEKVKIDTISYYKAVLKSKYWITNSSVKRGLNLKEKNHKNVFFTHGMTGIKKIGTDIKEKNQSFRAKKQEKFDMIVLGGKKEKEILVKAWQTEEKHFYEIGLPRNDELYHIEREKVLAIKQKLKLPLDKKVILYAPTYREFNKDNCFDNIIKNPFDFEKMEQELSDEYVLVVTAHYLVGKFLGLPKDNPFIINAFEYPYINDLLMIADILISDYSSVVWDYAILERPILCFGYDYDRYMEERGTYLDLEKTFFNGVIKTQEKLLEVIKNMDFEKQRRHTKKLKEEYVVLEENAAKKITQIILKEKKEGSK
jgi:CDP-glycerol glycerophosphotransferase